MFSLAGIPPLAGFLAKFYVFLAAIEANLYGLAIVGVLASVVGAYYYLRIVKLMFFDEAAEPFSADARRDQVDRRPRRRVRVALRVLPSAAGGRGGAGGEDVFLSAARRTIEPRRRGASTSIRVDSTNAEAWRRHAAGDRGPLWVTANRQTAGRGRSGRELGVGTRQPVRVPAAAARLRSRGVAAARRSSAPLPSLSAVAALLPAATAPRLRLKWPNDVLHEGSKLAGILIESSITAPSAIDFVIGIGINVASHPGDLARPTTCLAALGATVSVGQLLNGLDLALATELKELECRRWLSTDEDALA